MEKSSLSMIIQDLKSKRDALSLAHEQLKKDNDDWNKCIIVLSLATGMFESCKIKMGWDNNLVALVPILLSSIIASISALIKLAEEGFYYTAGTTVNFSSNHFVFLFKAIQTNKDAIDGNGLLGFIGNDTTNHYYFSLYTATTYPVLSG